MLDALANRLTESKNMRLPLLSQFYTPYFFVRNSTIEARRCLTGEVMYGNTCRQNRLGHALRIQLGKRGRGKCECRPTFSDPQNAQLLGVRVLGLKSLSSLDRNFVGLKMWVYVHVYEDEGLNSSVSRSGPHCSSTSPLTQTAQKRGANQFTCSRAYRNNLEPDFIAQPSPH